MHGQSTGLDMYISDTYLILIFNVPCNHVTMNFFTMFEASQLEDDDGATRIKICRFNALL